VISGAQKDFEDQITLGRALQSLSAKMLDEDILFFSHRRSLGGRLFEKDSAFYHLRCGPRNEYCGMVDVDAGSQVFMALCLRHPWLTTTSCLLPSALCYLLDAMPGWRNGRRYGLKIR
jgi:hypothetical protein